MAGRAVRTVQALVSRGQSTLASAHYEGKTLGDCLTQLAAEEKAAQATGIALWEQQGRNPYHCSRHNGPSDRLTVDAAGRPVCWSCVGMYGLAYDYRLEWNPEAREVEMVEYPFSDSVTGVGLPIGNIF